MHASLVFFVHFADDIFRKIYDKRRTCRTAPLFLCALCNKKDEEEAAGEEHEKILKNIWIFCKKGIDKPANLWYNTQEMKAEQPFSPCRNGAHGFIVVNPIPLLGVWCARLDGLCFPSDFFISKIGGTLLLAQKKC